MANLVTGGLGLPEEGSLVTGGLGATAPELPGAITATLTGSGAITATLTDGGTPPEETGGGWGWTAHHTALLHQQQAEAQRPKRRVVNISADLTGGSSVTATATATDNLLAGFDDLALLLTLELV